MDQLAGDLKVLLDTLEIRVADVYGVSYGGAIAQAFTIKYPERVRSLGVLASAPKGSPMLLERATKAEELGMDAMVASSLNRWFTATTVAENGWAVRYARSCVRRAKVESWASAWRVMADLDLVAGLPGIRVPGLAVAGAQDVSSPPALLRMIANATGGKYRELAEGTHMMNLEQPDEVLEVLKEFRATMDASVIQIPN